MDKKIILLPLLLLFQFVTAQEVLFSDGQLPNGLIYPIAQFSGNPGAEKTLNANILNVVSKYEGQDYCISQYGYVQQTGFIQLHFYFNCIDMDESKNEFHLFGLSDGEPCTTSALFLDKEKKRFRPYLHKRISEHFTANGKEVPSDDYLESISIDDCQVKLVEQGIEISIESNENWPDKNLLIFWGDLRPFLKTTFI